MHAQDVHKWKVVWNNSNLEACEGYKVTEKFEKLC